MNKFCTTCVHKNEKRFSNICDCCEFKGENTEPTKYIKISSDIHCKGYLFDSLVYRYKYALEMATEIRAGMITEQCRKNQLSKIEAMNKARAMNERDVLRFCQILDEAIGEHD